MTVTLRLFGALKGYLPEPQRKCRSANFELPDEITVRQLILHLGIPYGAEEGQIVAVVNDVEADHDFVIGDGASVSLFEPLAGG